MELPARPVGAEQDYARLYAFNLALRGRNAELEDAYAKAQAEIAALELLLVRQTRIHLALRRVTEPSTTAREVIDFQLDLDP